MPLFSFRCTWCDTDFETLVQSSEPARLPGVRRHGAGAADLARRPGGPHPGLVKRARTQAAKEGHFSNY